MNKPDLIWSLLLFVLLFLFVPEDEPDDQYDNEDTEGQTHHCTCYLTYILHICEQREDVMKDTVESRLPFNSQIVTVHALS